MWGGIMLTFLARAKVIPADTTLSLFLAQLQFSDQPRQAAVGNINTVFLTQELMHTHGIAFAKMKMLLDQWQQIFISAFPVALLITFNHPTYGIARDAKQSTDLTDTDFGFVQRQNRFFVGNRYHLYTFLYVL